MLFSLTTDLFSFAVVTTAVLGTYLLYYIGWIIYSRNFHPYHDLPGPYLASITVWWRWYAVRYAVEDRLQHGIHEQYGPLVRIAPDEVSISDPQAVDVIARPDFLKTEFYRSFDPGIGGRPEPFATLDEKIHAQHKRIVAPMFRSEAVMEYEGYVDRVISVFDDCMQTFAEGRRIFDLTDYITRFSWDTVGELMYSKKGGFGMLQGDDFMGWMEMLRIMPQPVSSLGYVPHGFGTLYFISMLIFSPQARRGLTSAMAVVKQVKILIQQRKDEEAAGTEFPEHDMLSKMMVMTRDEKIDFNEDDIAIMLNAFVWAGSDTTGSTLGMIMYFILSESKVLSRLRSELAAHFKSSEEVTYASASKLPYLTACINEGMRLHYIIGLGMPRYIPREGATILNRHFPGNHRLKVLANMQVMQSSTTVFGEDARSFRPERWLNADEKKLAEMQKYFHPWGIGVRVCLGRFIATMEIYKFVAETVMKWDFEIVEDEKQGGGKMKVSKGHIQQPSGMMVKVRAREGS